MRLLVYGGWYGSGNIGDDAILIGLRNLMETVLPSVELVALSSNPGQTERVCGVQAELLHSPRDLITGNGGAQSYYRVFRDVDAFIVSGGTPIYDYGHTSRLIHFSLPRALNKKTYCIGVGVKPLNSLHSKTLIRSLLDSVESISVRDHPSKHELEKAGVKKKISVTGDSALFLEYPGASSPAWRHTGKTAVIAPRRLSTAHRGLYHTAKTAGEVSWIRRLTAQVADWLSEKGYSLLFLPMHKVSPDDDLREISLIRGLMKSVNRGTVVREDLSPFEVSSLLGSVDLVFGSRLHSLILAAMKGTPVIGLDHDPKIGGFMTLAGAGELILSPCSSEVEAYQVLEYAVSEGEQIKRSLKGATDAMRKRIIRDVQNLC